MAQELCYGWPLCIMAEHIFQTGSVTVNWYCTDIIEGCVHLFHVAMGPKFIFINDNAHPHRVSETLKSEEIDCMPWPAYSPDLNPIDHAWDALGKCVA